MKRRVRPPVLDEYKNLLNKNSTSGIQVYFEGLRG